MILAMTAVERHLLDPSGLSALGDYFTHGFGCLAVATVLDRASDFFVHGARRGQRFARLVVDQLHVDMFVAARNAQSRPIPGAADTLSHAKSSTLASLTNFPFVVHRFQAFCCGERNKFSVKKVSFQSEP